MVRRSIVSNGDDETAYLVLDDFGDLGRCWRESDIQTTDLETVITDLMVVDLVAAAGVSAIAIARLWQLRTSEQRRSV